MLSEAFSSFVSAANVLERSYRDLQDELARLRLELQESHCDLDRSLRENERMGHWLSGIVESLPCGVIVLDENGQARLRNHEAVKLLSGGNAASMKIFSEAISQKTGREYEYELPGTNGQRAFSIKRAPIVSAGDHKKESVMILREITEQRRIEKEREANRRMQSLAEISAMLAHEIRNPLASMELFASLLGDSLENNTEESGWVEQIRAGLRLLSATVNNVLQFYSEAPAQLFPLQLTELVKTTISLLSPIARQHGIEIVFEPEVSNGTIDGDTHKLQQVFFNLAVNAFRAMKSGQKLTIALDQHHDSHICVEFRDQGCGISAADLNRIFQPGFSGSAKGPGLGLAVCKRIVEQHGGTISVLSAPSVGSTFSLEFPVIGDGE
ncbi:MAG TPA: ATP-binding protein [Candidatus Angelobacter sp.]|nr:ATP-binding protein [Candidatus Angelobacter sp.]